MKMSADEKRAELKRVMREYSVSSKDVAEILGRSSQTIRNWRSSSDAEPPINELRLLKFELEARNASLSTNEKAPADANS